MECIEPNCQKTRIIARGRCAWHYEVFRRNNRNSIRKFHTEDTKHPLYETWRGMKKRCYDSHNASYHNYGAKGVTVCDRWTNKDGFKNFVSDMGVKPKGTTLDRIDNTQGYSPENCRWLTCVEQNLNRACKSQHPYIYEKDSYWEVYIRRPGRFGRKDSYKRRCSTFDEAIKVRNNKLLEIHGKLPDGL